MNVLDRRRRQWFLTRIILLLILAPPLSAWGRYARHPACRPPSPCCWPALIAVVRLKWIS